MYDDLSIRQKAEIIRAAVRQGITNISDIKQKYNEFAEGGDLTPVRTERSIVEIPQEPDYDMIGMMKGRMATAAHFGNPTARRMTNYDTRSYTFTQDDVNRGYEGRAGDVGNVYVNSGDNLVTPGIQINSQGNLEFIPTNELYSTPERDRQSYNQAIKFNSAEDAAYFGEHYKEIAPMMNLYSTGGTIHIKPENRGKFTAAAKSRGMGVQEFANKVLANKDDYSSTMVRRANFARNTAHWNAFGGHLYGGEDEWTQQLDFAGNPVPLTTYVEPTLKTNPTLARQLWKDYQSDLSNFEGKTGWQVMSNGMYVYIPQEGEEIDYENFQTPTGSGHWVVGYDDYHKWNSDQRLRTSKDWHKIADGNLANIMSRINRKNVYRGEESLGANPVIFWHPHRRVNPNWSWQPKDQTTKQSDISMTKSFGENPINIPNMIPIPTMDFIRTSIPQVRSNINNKIEQGSVTPITSPAPVRTRPKFERIPDKAKHLISHVTDEGIPFFKFDGYSEDDVIKVIDEIARTRPDLIKKSIPKYEPTPIQRKSPSVGNQNERSFIQRVQDIIKQQHSINSPSSQPITKNKEAKNKEVPFDARAISLYAYPSKDVDVYSMHPDLAIAVQDYLLGNHDPRQERKPNKYYVTPMPLSQIAQGANMNDSTFHYINNEGIDYQVQRKANINPYLVKPNELISNGRIAQTGYMVPVTNDRMIVYTNKNTDKSEMIPFTNTGYKYSNHNPRYVKTTNGNRYIRMPNAVRDDEFVTRKSNEVNPWNQEHIVYSDPRGGFRDTKFENTGLTEAQIKDAKKKAPVNVRNTNIIPISSQEMLQTFFPQQKKVQKSLQKKTTRSEGGALNNLYNSTYLLSTGGPLYPFSFNKHIPEVRY